MELNEAHQKYLKLEKELKKSESHKSTHIEVKEKIVNKKMDVTEYTEY